MVRLPAFQTDPADVLLPGTHDLLQLSTEASQGTEVNDHILIAAYQGTVISIRAGAD